jgi:5'-methylthioadenosine phosphorylase
MRVDVGIIGGTGIGDRLLALGGTPVHIPTPAGILRGRLTEANGIEVLVVGRHSSGHKVPPHEVNYAAMALGMRSLGIRYCLSTAAVGSLRSDWGPGTLVSCSDFLDFSGRTPTLFNRTVTHTDFTYPFSKLLREKMGAAATTEAIPVTAEGVYVCANGPRYETPQEIELYQQAGGDLVGMTATSEAILMREAGIEYGCLAIVTNFASGISSTPLNHLEVVEEMNRSGERAVKMLLATVTELRKE